MNQKSLTKNERLHRIIDTLKAINKVVVDEEDAGKLIKRICEVLTEIRGYYFAWVGLFNQKNELTQIEHAGKFNGFDKLKNDAFKGLLPVQLEKALDNQKFTIVKTPQEDCPFSEKNLKYYTYIAPITVSNELQGMLCAAVPIIDAQHPKEAETFKDLADNLGYAISNLKGKNDFNELISSAQDAYIIFDKHHTIKMVNKSFCEIFNRDEEYFKNKDIKNLIELHFSQQDNRELYKALELLLKGSLIDNLEFEYKNKVLRINSKIHSLSKFRIGILKDITKDKHEKLELQKRETNYRNLVEGLNDSIFIIQDGLIKYVNPALCHVSGYEQSELINIHFSKFVDESEVERVLTTFNKRKHEANTESNYKSIAKTKNGGRIPVEITVIPVEYEKETALQVILRDISKEEKAIQQLKESEERFRFLSESAFEGIAIHENGIIIDLNNAMAQLSGYKRKELIGRSIYDFFLGKRDVNLVKKHSAHQNSIPYVVQGITKTGKIVYMEIESKGIINNGKEVRIAGIRNITDRFQLTQRLKETTHQLNNLLNNLPGMAYTCLNSKNWEMQFMSKGCEDLTGYTPEDFAKTMKNDYSAIIHPDDRRRVWHKIQKAIENNTPFELEYRIKSKDGKEKWVWERGVQTKQKGSVRLEGLITDITKRKHAVDAFKKSETKYRTLFNAINDAILIHPYDGIEGQPIMELNNEACELYGYSREELLKLSIQDLTPEDNLRIPVTFEKRGNLLEHPYSTFETRQIKKNGEIVPVEISSRIFIIAGKKLILSVIRDITYRKEAEKNLIISEQRYRAVFENTGAATCILENDGIISLANSQFAKLSGYDLDEIINKKYWTDFVHPDDLKTMQDRHKIRRKNANEALINYQFRFIDKNNQLKHINIFVDMIPGTQKSVTSLIDITWQVKADRALKESELKLSSIANSARDAIILLDHTGNIVFWNPAAEKMFGYSQSEVIHKNLHHLIAPAKYIKEHKRGFADFKNSGDGPIIGKTTELKAITKNNNIIPVEISLAPTKINNQWGATGIIRDITERKLAEEKLHASEKLQETILKSMPSGFIMIDDSYKIVKVNDRVCQITGYTREELEGQLCNMVCPKGQKSQECIILSKGERSFSGVDTLIKCKNNQTTPILKNAQTINIDGKTYLLESFIDIGARKKAEQELIKAKNKAQESEQKFSAFMKYIPGSAFIKDKDLNFVYVNKFMENNMNAGDWIGKNTKKVIHPNLAEKMIEDDLKALRQGRHKYEEQFPVNGKGIRDFLTYKFTIGEENSQKLIGGISIDITERKRLEGRNTMLSKAIDASPASVVITDINGNIEYVNPFFEEKTGYTQEKVKGKNPRVLKSGEQGNEFYKEMWNTILQGKIWRGEFHNRKKNGELFWEKGSISPVTNGDGEIIQFIAIKEDISQQKKILTDLRQAKEQAEKSAQKVIAQKDIIQFHNERLESLFRISQLSTNSIQELLDYTLNEAVLLTKSKIGYIYFYNEDTKQFTLNTWSKDVMQECKILNPDTVYNLDKTGCWGEAVRQKRPIIINNYKAENKIKKGTPEGHVQLNKFLTIPVFSDNKIVAVAGVANKVLNYNQSDIRQLTLLMDSVWKIVERIRLIDDLNLAKNKAVESDKLKSAFLANMSHEIRTPMNGILGFTELLKEPDLTGEQQNEFISIIQKSGQRMLSTINDIIDISKIESGLVTIKKEQVDLKIFMNDILLFFEPETLKKGVKLEFINTNDPSFPTIKTDSEKLNSIITNLIKNAVKFTTEGIISFGYKIGENTITFIVKDTGIGIPKERQHAIFDRFVQADIADSRVYEGSGLGLSISKSYTEMLGGTIHFESAEGAGTTFYVNIPYLRESSHVDKTEALPEDLFPHKKLKILIAEDDPISIELLKILLENMSKEILLAKNGQEAIEMARTHLDLDLILMDIKMPNIDGFHATETIRTFNKNVKIIAQTAFAQEQDAIKALEAGFNDYITKPINKQNLYSLIIKQFKSE